MPLGYRSNEISDQIRSPGTISQVSAELFVLLNVNGSTFIFLKKINREFT